MGKRKLQVQNGYIADAILQTKNQGVKQMKSTFCPCIGKIYPFRLGMWNDRIY